MPDDLKPNVHPLTPQQAALLSDMASALFVLRCQPMERLELLAKTLIVREGIQRLHAEVKGGMVIQEDDGEVQ